MIAQNKVSRSQDKCFSPPNNKPISEYTQEELGKQPIQQWQASELIASRFLKYCKICGHPIVEKIGWNWEYLPQNWLESKKERLEQLNKKNSDI